MHSRDEEGDKDQPTVQTSAAAPPVTRLYRHALESILGMLTLSELNRILVVSREWAAAVRSMKPINALLERDYWRSQSAGAVFCPLPPIAHIVRSPLLRHVAAIHVRQKNGRAPLTYESLGLLGQHVPNLTSLWCTLTLTPNEPLVLPVRLKSLQLQLGSEYTDETINGVLTTSASLPLLSHLHLTSSAFERQSAVDVSCLAACPSLTDLTFATGYALMFTDAQVEQIRSALGHLHRISVGWMEPGMLARLLKPPVTAHWSDIGQVQADERSEQLLLDLPGLTKLDLYYPSPTPHVDFLPQLPLLTSLSLGCDRTGQGNRQAWSIPPKVLLAALVRCSCLTELHLKCGFRSADWSALFAKLPIKKLTIRGGAIESLWCFKAGPITQSLEDLTLDHLLSLPPSEILHLHSLSRLRSLRLDDGFSPRVDDATILRLSPPTPLLPALACLDVQWRTAIGMVESQQRKGPSFKWTQQP